MIIKLSSSLNSDPVVNKLNAYCSCDFFNQLFSFVFNQNILVCVTYVFSLNDLAVRTAYPFVAAVLVTTLLHLDAWHHFIRTVIVSNFIDTRVFNLLGLNQFGCLFRLFDTIKLLFLSLVLTDNKLLLLRCSLIDN